MDFLDVIQTTEGRKNLENDLLVVGEILHFATLRSE